MATSGNKGGTPRATKFTADDRRRLQRIEAKLDRLSWLMLAVGGAVLGLWIKDLTLLITAVALFVGAVCILALVYHRFEPSLKNIVNRIISPNTSEEDDAGSGRGRRVVQVLELENLDDEELLKAARRRKRKQPAAAEDEPQSSDATDEPQPGTA